jgi:hypothetical protein
MTRRLTQATNYSARICLIRAIASSTACSGLMPSAMTRFTAFPGQLLRDLVVAPVARDRGVVVVRGARRDLHRRGHAVRVARVEPERCLAQFRHRRHKSLASEVEVVGEPALCDEEAHELLGGIGVAALPEDRRSPEQAHDRKSLAARAERPFDRCGVLVVILGPLGRLSAMGIERVSFCTMTTACARNCWLLSRLEFQAIEPGGVQPLR